jgi:hypothetical protein
VLNLKHIKLKIYVSVNMKFLVAIISLTIAITTCEGVENAQRRVAPALEMCYRNRQLFERDNRLPMTINTLIELIRKVETSPGFNMDIRQLTVALVHRFRQDGILPARLVQPNQDDILPFSPSDFTFQKHRVLLTRLLPGNAQLFPNQTLTAPELCALHFMLSTSIETQVRGDENVRCNQLAQFRSIRVPREANDDTELVNKNKRLLQKLKSGRLQAEVEDQTENDYLEEENQEENIEEPEPKVAEENEDEAEIEGVDVTGRNVDVDIASTALSQCPVENGVISTQWGSISGGALIAGIAAGLQPQTVQLRDLMVGPRGSEDYRKFARQQEGVALRVDNRFASTLSGDLAEAVLMQAPSNPQVGAPGTFNSTMLPRWYFLSQRERLQMTDAEIRGGLDGLILGQNIAQWRNQANNLRLSQVLSLYYSQRGVFSPEFRACNRTNLFTTVAPLARLRDETVAFATVLDGETTTSVTLNPQSITRLGRQAADALAQYIPSSMNNIGCATTARQVNDQTIWSTSTDLLIFVDTALLHAEIQQIVSNLLNQLDFYESPSQYTIFDTSQGNILVNTTNMISTLAVNWNQAVHTASPNGFNIGNVYATIRERAINMMMHDRTTGTVGGRSFIALIIVGEATVQENLVNTAVQEFQIIREQIPDLRFIYWARGTLSRFDRFVRQPQRDTFILPASNVPSNQIRVVAERIQEEPRRIINHRCGPEWTNDNPGTSQMNQFIGAREIAFYRVAPNYFFRESGNRRVQIRGSGFGPLTVCHSRSVELPRSTMNGTTNQDVSCRVINSDAVDINLSNPCDGHERIVDCRPQFISVEGPSAIDPSNIRCTEAACRFPTDIRFTIVTTDLGCFSNAKTIVASLTLIILSIILTF